MNQISGEVATKVLRDTKKGKVVTADEDAQQDADVLEAWKKQAASTYKDDVRSKNLFFKFQRTKIPGLVLSDEQEQARRAERDAKKLKGRQIKTEDRDDPDYCPDKEWAEWANAPVKPNLNPDVDV